MENTDRESGFPRGVPLIIMEPSVHGEDVLAAPVSDNECSRMSLDCGYGKMGDVLVGNLRPNVYLVHQIAQTASKNNGGLGVAVVQLLFKPKGCFLNVLF